MLRSIMVRSALIVFTCAMSIAAYAYASDPKPIDVKAGDLTAALESLAKQAGVELVYQSDQLKGLRTQGLKGTFTAEDAVTKLLEGTPLTFRKDSSGAMLIAPPKLPLSSPEEREGPAEREGEGNPSPGTGGGGTAQREVRIAQADDEKKSESSKEDSERKSGYESQELPAPEETGKAIPEILVRGSKSLNTDIRRTRDDTQPYVVFGAEEIQRTQAMTLDDFFKTRLTMNTVQTSLSQTTFGAASNSRITLRGLGENQTLILLNGRRMPGIVGGSTFSQPDVRAIPLGAIERIEVLPATASGIYGGGATGGVVNIITRRDFDGVELVAGYDNTSQWDMGNRRINVAAGTNLWDDRTQLLFAASHSDAESLLYGDRTFTYEGRLLRDSNNPVTGLPSPILSYTPNVCSAASATATICSAAPLVLRNGTSLGSNVTFVPAGYAGSSADGGSALAANAGRYTIDLPDDLSGARRSALNAPILDSALAGLRREFSSNLAAFVDLSWYRNKGQTHSAGLPITATISASAPNNPFTSPILVSFPSPTLSYTVDDEIDVSLAMGGAILRLPRGWVAEADYVWGRSRQSSYQTFPALHSSFNAAVASGAVNVLRDLNAFPLDYSSYLLPSPNTIIEPTRLILRDLSLRVSGPVMNLPAGTLTLTSLLAHREESDSDVIIHNMSAVGVATQALFPARSQKVGSAYIEARAPLFSSALGTRPFLRALDLQASVRRDEYETEAPSPNSASGPPFASFVNQTNRTASTDYTVGLRLAPFEPLTLRASYGTGFLPPSVSQISPARQITQTPTGAAALRDPRRGGALGSVVPYTAIGGGSPGLRSEKSESFSVGAILAPPPLPRFRVSLDFVRIKKSDEIRTVSAQQIIDLEDFFPSRITRAPLTPADIALGYTGGLITAIDTSLINAASTHLEAYDLQADYSFKTPHFGDFQLYSLVTRQPSFTVTPAPSIPSFDTVGYDSGVLEWRANAGVIWRYRAWTLAWNAQYLDSYKVYSATANTATRAAAVLDQGSDTIGSQTYHDLSLAYRFNTTWAKAGGLSGDSEVLFGMQNVFDARPPILATTSANGGYSTHADPRLRRFTLSARVRW